MIDGDAYAQLAADTQAAIAALITATVTVAGTPPVVKARVLTEDPVNINEAQWAAALLSDTDTDENSDKRIHAWLVTFAGSTDVESTTVRSIEPTFRYRVQVYYTLDTGSEARIRAEALKVQLAIAKSPKLSLPGLVTKHHQLPIEVRPRRFGGNVIHYGETEIAVDVQPLNVY